MSARTALKAATSDAHDRVDAAFAAHDLSDAASYGDFLQRHAAALGPLEQALADAGAGALIPDFDEHRRAPLLADDLRLLGLTAPPPLPAPRFASDEQAIGGLYVLEGSRLGGAVLRRGVLAGLPRAFLSAPQSPGRWAGFVASLDQLLYSRQRLDAAIAAAIDSFGLFERAAKDKA